MRKIVLLVAGLLAATGLPLTFFSADQLSGGWRKAFSLFHTWAGVLFLVVFALYAWDHISARRRWLRILARVTVSGLTQTAASLVIIASGVVLLLYGDQAWLALRAAHHWLTYLLAASIVLHYLSPKS